MIAHIRHAALVELRRVRWIVETRLVIVAVGMIVVVFMPVFLRMRVFVAVFVSMRIMLVGVVKNCRDRGRGHARRAHGNDPVCRHDVHDRDRVNARSYFRVYVRPP